MDTQNKKCVMIIDENLPIGILANTTAIMGATLGKNMPEAIGMDVTDKNGNRHLGISGLPIPILKASKSTIKEIRTKLYASDFSDMLVVDFSDVAQSCNDYDDFIYKMSESKEEDIAYFGVAICGSKKKVNKLTGSMPLLR